MEPLPDRAHVRLRSPVHGTYLHADEDGWGVSLSPHRASLHTAWAVHLVLAPSGTTSVLLHSAAYGRYLALSPELAQDDLVLHTVQRAYETPLHADVMWEVLPAEDGNEDVRLRHAVYRALAMSLWVVEAIPPRLMPPQLPEQIPNGVENPVLLRRIIRFVRADRFGIFILPWRTFEIDGRSFVNLIGTLAIDLDANFNDITLCVKAGFLGRVTPLVIDLPMSEEPMDVIVYATDSPAALDLRHPDVDAP